MQLSVIILNYNAAAFLELCLTSVSRAIKNIDAEIIVADNNSSDSSLQMLSANFSQLKVIVNQENIGFSRANNRAVQQAQGEYICILNPDVIVGEQIFDRCYAFAKAQSKTAFIGTQLIDGRGIFLPESKRNIPTPSIARQKLMGNDTNYYASHVERHSRAEVDVLVGALMFCQKEIYEECGGFDERYFMYGEDIDLSYTALQKGYVNYYLGDLTAIHFKGESTVKDTKYLKRFYGAMELFYDKYFARSVIEKAIASLAIKAFVLLKSNKKQVAQSGQLTDNAILVTNEDGYNNSFFAQKMRFDELYKHPLKNVEIVWDLKSLDYADVITFMSENSELTIKYRFLNERRTFILGSDSSTVKGFVKELSV